MEETSVEYLTFTLGEENYAVCISKVREVLEFDTVTKVPQTPDFMRGVINLRGHVVPVLDLRLKFGMSATEKTINTCVVIVEVLIDEENTIIGVLTDSVKEVMQLENDSIEPAPKLGNMVNPEFILGMGKYNDQFLILLNIDKTFSSQELESLQQVSKAPKEAS
jgi:purine-binding chemotaxis protein CheW